MTKSNKHRNRVINRGAEILRSSGLPVLDLPDPQLPPSVSSQGKKKILENWHGNPGSGLPQRHSPMSPTRVIFPAYPISLSLARFRAHRGRWGSASGRSRGYRHHLPGAASPTFSGNSLVVSKLVLRDQRQRSKTTAKPVKTLTQIPNKEEPPDFSSLQQSRFF